MEGLLIPTKYKMSNHHEDFVKAIMKNSGVVNIIPIRTGKKLIMDEVKRQNFYRCVTTLIDSLHSDHPSDKEVVHELLAKLSQEEILLMREMLVKVGKVFYVRNTEG